MKTKIHYPSAESSELLWNSRIIKDEKVCYLAVGALELATVLSMMFGRLKKYFLFFTVMLMLGAIFHHLEFDYSFKSNGFETPLTYFLLSLGLLFNTKKNEIL